MKRTLHFGFPSAVRGVGHGLVHLFLPQCQMSCICSAGRAGSPLTFCLPRAADPGGVLPALLCSALEEQAPQPGGSMNAGLFVSWEPQASTLLWEGTGTVLQLWFMLHVDSVDTWLFLSEREMPKATVKLSVISVSYVEDGLYRITWKL